MLMSAIGAVFALVVGAFLVGLGLCIIAAFVLFLRTLWYTALDRWRDIGRAGGR